MNDKAQQMGTEPIAPLLARFSWPMIVSMLASSLYNLVDRVFVGRGVGQDALAGVTVAFPLFIFIYSLGLLFGIGAAAVSSISLGRGERDFAAKALGNALLASLVAASVFIAAAYVFIDPILSAFGGRGEVLAEARVFSRIFLVGSLFQVIGLVLASAVRAEGDPSTALVATLGGVAINLVLNPLFIFVLKLGVAGSALATTIGEACSCAYVGAYYAKGKGQLALHRASLKPEARVMKSIVGIGFAPFVAQLSACLMIALSNRAAASYGTEALEVMGVIYVLYPFVLQPLNGIAGGAQPIIGYNYGARAFDRVRKTLFISILAGTALCAAEWILILAAPARIVGLFCPDGAAMALGARELRIFFACIPLAAIQAIGANYFLAVGKAGISFFNNLLRQLILIVPLLLVLPRYLGLDGVCWSNPISDAASAAVAAGFLAAELRRLKAIEGGAS
jgi:putative efflux protein, MATE family